MKESILVWGTGNGSRLFMERIAKDKSVYDVDIIAFVDNDEKRWGDIYLDKPVISPEEAVNNYMALIVVASGFYYNEIRKQIICELFVPSSRVVSSYHYLNDRYTKDIFFKRYGKTKKRTVIYTANIGQYDTLREPQFVSDDIDYVCFTDDVDFHSEVWQVRPLVWDDSQLTNRLKSKKHKLFAHLLFPEYERSIWIDSSAWIKKDLRRYAEVYMKESDMLCFPHPERNCLYGEGWDCIKNRVDRKDVILKQMDRYRADGYPSDNGLIVSACMVRHHMEGSVIKVMEDWWEEISGNSIRDQISFPYVCWKNKFIYDLCDLDPTENEYYELCHHKAKRETY